MKNFLWTLVVIFSIVMIFGSSAQAENKKLKIGVLQWNDCMSVSMAAEYTLERFGYEVEQVEFFEWVSPLPLWKRAISTSWPR